MCEDTNNEDVGILNKTLQELIKLIRFYQIDRKVFIHVIWDHKHLLSEELFKDLVHCLIDSDAKPLYNPFLIRWGNFKIDSELVDKEIALILTKWINKKTTNKGPDLHVLDGSRSWKFQAKSYPKILNVDSFMISFYEVFQIVNNITKKSA
ncbi:32460_t:CDS:2 [Gigaspora margarita]|uniref:32460_t:CDS:1 n=1 Tax=Gigaspora margarita TaxID=4874 RepID=A0ABN7UGV6_GIGMA|nr:32460_t:CDS:2 [Gigaspora margarita]